MEFVLFLFSLCIAVLLPGWVVGTSFWMKKHAIFSGVLSSVLGIILWTAQGYIFGYLGVRWMTYVFIFAFMCVGFLQRGVIRKNALSWIHALRSMDRVTMGLINLGAGIQSLQMIGSGWQTNLGMNFFRVHAQDGIFHLSLIRSIAKSFPPMESGVVGVPVVNYHYWSDLFFAELFRIFHIPIEHLFFWWIPPYIALLTGLATIGLVSIWVSQSKITLHADYEKWFGRSAVFLLFLSGDLAYVVMYLLHGHFGFYTSAIDNGATQFLNMPHSFAKLIFIVWLAVFLLWVHRPRKQLGICLAVLAAVLLGMKVYFGLLAGAIFGFYGAVDFVMTAIKERRILIEKAKTYLLIGVVWGSIGLAIYLPPNRGSGGLGYYPLEWVKLFLAAENLDWTALRYRIAIAAYEKNVGKQIAYDAISIFVTLLCIHGTRLLGILPTKSAFKWMNEKVVIALSLSMLLWTFLGLYTLQKSGGFNVFNFFASSLVIFSVILASTLTSWWVSGKILLRSIVILCCLFSVPRVVYETHKILTSYVSGTDVLVISHGEQDALRYIRLTSMPDVVVQSHPENSLDFSTPYVSFFSDRSSYIAGVKVLETHNQPSLSRVDEVRKAFRSGSSSVFLEEMRRLNIDYVYLRKNAQERLPAQGKLQEKIVFENDAAAVYDVR